MHKSSVGVGVTDGVGVSVGSGVRVARSVRDAALAFLCNVGLEDDPTAAPLGHLVYGQRELKSVPVRFSIGRLKGRRSFVFARAGYGKSNLIKYLMSQLYSSPPDVGLLIFDPEGEYALPDAHGRPGLVNVPALRRRISLYTNRPVEPQHADVVKGIEEKAREARLIILDLIRTTIAAPRPELKAHAPRITTVHINPEKIGALIGPGGKNVRGIQDDTGAIIDIHEDGTVYIAATNGASAEAARARVEGLTESVEIGKIYTGKVVRTTDFGAFVEIVPGTDGMVHISQLADYRAPTVESVVKLGDEVMVMVTDVDPAGKIRLSRRAVLEGLTVEQAREMDKPKPGGGDRPRGGGDRDRRGGGDRRSGGGNRSGNRH